MILLVIPGQLIFLGAIALLEAGHVQITTTFTILYLISSILQVRHFLFLLKFLDFFSKKVF